MKQLQQKQQKLRLRENTKKPNNWRKNHLTLPFDFTNNLTPAPIQWHTNTREATGRLRAKETFMMSLTSFNGTYVHVIFTFLSIFILYTYLYDVIILLLKTTILYIVVWAYIHTQFDNV